MKALMKEENHEIKNVMQKVNSSITGSEIDLNDQIAIGTHAMEEQTHDIEVALAAVTGRLG